MVVTGARKGMVSACATAFAREGAMVVGVSRDPGNLLEATQQLEARGRTLLPPPPADLKDGVAAQAMMELIGNKRGPIDVLVNCAGAALCTPPDELDAAILKAAMQSKYFSCMRAIEPDIRCMGALGAGSIVSVIEQGGWQADPQHIGGHSATAALMLASVGCAKACALA